MFSFHLDVVFHNIHIYIQQQLRVLWKGNHRPFSHFMENEAEERETICSQPLVRKHHCRWLSCSLPPAASLKKEHFFTFIHLKHLEEQQVVSGWMCFKQMRFNPMHL